MSPRADRLGILLAGVLVAGTVTTCSGREPEGPLQELRFGVLLSVDQLPYFVMREQGFDRANGLQITEVVMDGGPALIDGLAAGTIDVGFPGSIPMFNASRVGVVPRNAVAVASVALADAEHRAFAVLGGPGIDDWSDLAGKQVAVNQPGTIGDVAVRLRLAMEGVEGARLVSIPFPNQGLAVAGGTVAAAVMVEPFITQSLARGDAEILDWIVGGGEPFPVFQESVVAVSTRYLTERPDAVRAFLRAELQAVAWIAAHERDARTLLARRLELTDDVGRSIQLVYWPAAARNDPTLLAPIRDAMVELEPSPAPVTVSDLYDENLLEEVLVEERPP